MSDSDGWVRSAILDDTEEPHEVADSLATKLVDTHRVTEVLGDGSYPIIEERQDSIPRWVRVGSVDADNSEIGEHLAENLNSDEFRVISVYRGGVYIERWVGDEP